MLAHLHALVLDSLNRVNHAVLVHSLILIHVGAESTCPHDEEDQLMDGRAFLVLVASRALVVVDPVLDEGLQRRVRRDDRVCCQLATATLAH